MWYYLLTTCSHNGDLVSKSYVVLLQVRETAPCTWPTFQCQSPNSIEAQEEKDQIIAKYNHFTEFIQFYLEGILLDKS